MSVQANTQELTSNCNVQQDESPAGETVRIIAVVNLANGAWVVLAGLHVSLQ